MYICAFAFVNGRCFGLFRDDLHSLHSSKKQTKNCIFLDLVDLAPLNLLVSTSFVFIVATNSW